MGAQGLPHICGWPVLPQVRQLSTVHLQCVRGATAGGMCCSILLATMYSSDSSGPVLNLRYSTVLRACSFAKELSAVQALLTCSNLNLVLLVHWMSRNVCITRNCMRAQQL